MTDKVLVTGATGFIAQHCILQLLEAGYDVRGTARGHGRTQAVADVLAPHLSEANRSRLTENFEVVSADLLSDDGWDDAVKDCRYVLHVASPFPPENPKNEDDLIIPARDGALRVLRAASSASVQRVVMTSSIAAVLYGRVHDHVFTEDDWSNVDGPHIGAYEKSKTLAERAAWDFITSLGDGATMDLVTINPGLVLGPLLTNEWSLSAELVKKMMERAVPAIPDLRVVGVDVRDVANAHLLAMTTPAASGQRFLCAIESHPIRDIALILAAHLDNKGFKIPTRRLPGFVLPVIALWDKQVRLVLHDVGEPLEINNARIRTVLGLEPRGLAEMSTSMADSLIKYAVVTPKK